MRSRLCVTVFGGMIAAALFAACAEGTDFDGDTADAAAGGDRGNRDAEVASSSSSGGSSSSGQTSSSSGASVEVDAGEVDDAATDATADDASVPIDTDAGGSSSSSSGVVPPAPADPILHSATANPTSINAPQGNITFALNMSDVNGDYKHIEMVLIYPDNTRENKSPVVIPASYDGNPGPFTLNLPVNFQTEETGNYKFAFRVVDDTNRKSAELRVDIRVR